MAELQYLKNDVWIIAYVVINGEPWFRALDISKILGYIDSGSMMLSCHVSSHDRISLDDVYNRSSPFINTSGLTKIMHHSTKKNKFALNAWLVKKELPKLIKTDDQLNDEGNDDQPNDDIVEIKPFELDEATYRRNRVIDIDDERSLQIAVVKFIRRRYPNMKIIDSGGKQVFTDEKTNKVIFDDRLERWELGYEKGCCDLQIQNAHREYRGLCIELKSPKGFGELMPHQREWLSGMNDDGYKILVSNDMFEIVEFLFQYNQGIIYKN